MFPRNVTRYKHRQIDYHIPWIIFPGFPESYFIASNEFSGSETHDGTRRWLKRHFEICYFQGSQAIITFLLSKNDFARLGGWSYVLVHEGANGEDFLPLCSKTTIPYTTVIKTNRLLICNSVVNNDIDRTTDIFGHRNGRDSCFF